MKRILVLPVLLVLAVPAAAEGRLFVSVGAQYVRPADAQFRQVYAAGAVLPCVAAAVRLVDGLCLTAGAGTFSKTGTTPELELESRATQSYIAVGLGYLLRASPTVCFEAGGGIAGLRYKETALGMSVRGRHPGFRAEAGVLLMPEGEKLFMSLKAGLLAGRVVPEPGSPTGSTSVKLGGPFVSVSIGLQLFGAGD